MVNLLPMTQDEFQAYLARAIPEYAQEKVRSGNWEEAEALDKSREIYEKLLPKGLTSPDQYFFTVFNPEDGTQVGMVWFAILTVEPQPKAFIYDFFIEPAHRRKGFGSQTMQVVEEKVKSLDIHRIGLHVFAHNRQAWALYKRLGYEETNINMEKVLQ